MKDVTLQFRPANIPLNVKHKIIKEALKNSALDQLALIKRYEKAVAEGKIKPVD